LKVCELDPGTLFLIKLVLRPPIPVITYAVLAIFQRSRSIAWSKAFAPAALRFWTKGSNCFVEKVGIVRISHAIS
jgi:hypothetical protein